MKSAILRVLAVGAVAAMLAGCGSSSNNNPLAESSAGANTGAAASSSADGGKPSGSVTLYTSQPDTDVAAMVKAFNQKYPDVKVNVFRSGTEEVISKLEAEKKAGSPQADVVFVADALSMEKLKSDDMLAKYSSPEAKGIDSRFVDADGYYTGTKIIATGIAVNTDKVKNAPTSWKIFTDPATKGQGEMASPLYSGAAAYNVALLAQDSGFGWDYWQKVADNGMTVTKGNGAVLKDVASGAKPYGMVVGFIVARAAKEGSPVKFIYPDEGVMAITEPIALTSSAKNPAAAKAFIDFVMSDEGQKVESQLGYVPLRDGAPVPDGLKSAKDAKVIEGDLKQLYSSVDSAKEKFKTMFHQ